MGRGNRKPWTLREGRSFQSRKEFMRQPVFNNAQRDVTTLPESALFVVKKGVVRGNGASNKIIVDFVNRYYTIR